MKTLKSSLVAASTRIKKGVLWAFALCLMLSVSAENLMAQKSSEISESTLLQFERILQEEINDLTEEVETQYSSIDVDVNKSIIHFYIATKRDYRNNSIQLREAFENNLSKMAPPRYDNVLTDNLFQGWTGDDDALVTSGTPDGPSAELTEFIDAIDISNGDFQSVQNLINFINDNRH